MRLFRVPVIIDEMRYRTARPSLTVVSIRGGCAEHTPRDTSNGDTHRLKTSALKVLSVIFPNDHCGQSCDMIINQTTHQDEVHYCNKAMRT